MTMLVTVFRMLLGLSLVPSAFSTLMPDAPLATGAALLMGASVHFSSML
jgi:hypothetical protein